MLQTIQESNRNMRFHVRLVRSVLAIVLAFGVIGFAFAQPPATKDAAKTPAAKDAAKKDSAKNASKDAAKKDAAKAPDAKAKAADPPPPTAPPAAAPAAAPAATDANRPAAAEYQKVMEDWKTVLKEL